MIKGVVGHVDGVGQCFIDTRNVSNGVTECQKVSRNFIINDLIKNKRKLFGWNTAMQLLKSEYDLDLTQGDTALRLYTTIDSSQCGRDHWPFSQVAVLGNCDLINL